MNREFVMSTIATNDAATIFYTDWGARTAPPILFHHGWPLSGDNWNARTFLEGNTEVLQPVAIRRTVRDGSLASNATRERG
jgi:pimeloyl-ACP methyl ester carboxylesterase